MLTRVEWAPIFTQAIFAMHENVFYRHFIRFIFYQANIEFQNRAKKVKKPFSWGSRELIKDLILLKGQLALIERHITGSKWLKIVMHKD